MNCLVRLYYIEMAKLIAFWVLVCFEFSRQGVAAVEKSKDITLAELSFPEQQIIRETYPLNIDLDNEKEENLKSTETDLDDQMWADYIDVTLAVEDWMLKANPSMGLFRWLKILEEGSVAKGTVPKCSIEVTSIFEDYQNSWTSDGDDKLMEEYDKLVSVIEEWMTEANPKMSRFKWLEVLEKGTAASCDDYDSSSYDYYYDNDVESLMGDRESNRKRLPTSSQLKFKRFTSV